MAGYGLKCWDDSGDKVTLDLTYKISRLRYSVEVAAGASSSVVLSDIDGKSTVQFAIALETSKLPHAVSRSGTTISWTARSGFTFSSAASLILVFLYD